VFLTQRIYFGKAAKNPEPAALLVALSQEVSIDRFQIDWRLNLKPFEKIAYTHV
jgi:hypothetical protein